MRRLHSLRLRRVLIAVLVPLLAVIFTLFLAELGMRLSGRGVPWAWHHKTSVLSGESRAIGR